MFDFLRSEKSKLRKSAGNWLELAERVYDYRRDLITAAQLERLQAARAKLKALVKQKADVEPLKKGIEELEAAMRDCGGRVYPSTSMAENVEFFLVAAIVILGLRAYFVQPFKIPTNSMWPSYYGMTSEVFKPGEEPGPARRVARLVGLGAMRYTLKAPADGEVMVPVFGNTMLAFKERPGRTMLIFPTMLKSYGIRVGGQDAWVEVPGDFDYSTVIDETFRGQGDQRSFNESLNRASRGNNNVESSMLAVRPNMDAQRVFWVPTGRMVKKGDTVVSFDILTGDLLFVERVSYNFVRPKVGSGFVFRTENIHSDEMTDLLGRQIKQYYVKRLVGTPGDTLEIRPPVLYRNGKPIEGSPAFDKNARREGLYPGYTGYGGSFLPAGTTLTIPEHSYFAMGDNSPRSKDSRAWGFVPENDVVGRPLFIYYPITSRWGPAR